MAKTELREETRKFFELNGFREFTNIQKMVIETRRRKKDLIAVGATGTGKTHAFLFAVSEIIDPEKDETQVIISAPTRELAFQINSAAAVLKEVYPGLRVKMLSGGTDSTRARQGFKNAPHIIIGTPGRIRSF
ncbi:MAG: DEAD/DEAH box helicase, partial [Erysipelotrichaceae bacterium]|nr:DEAD/DEAH box helicase [Erysipelotrichaceae bacterium]